MVIYTKRGDSGTTSLYDKSKAQRIRVSKNSKIIRALGAIDELNSYLGVVISEPSVHGSLTETIKSIQANLFTIGAVIAGSGLKFSDKETSKLEELIDQLEGKHPPLKNFILPGGSKTGAQLHYARTLVRRAEREIVAIKDVYEFDEQIMRYINRLSDCLFMLARDVNINTGIKEEVWVKRNKR